MGKNLMSAFILIAFWWINFYLGWITWFLEFFLAISIYSLVFYWIYYWYKYIRKKTIKPFTYFLSLFLYKISLFMFFITAFLGTTAFIINSFYPAEMPEYTLSNWIKTVKFQWMVHIGQLSYYETIKNNLIEYKEDWAVYYFEWVKWWTEKNMSDFNEALWVDFTPDLYENFSKLYWVGFQDTQMFLWLVNDKDYNVDLNIDEIMEIYNSNLKNKAPSEKKDTISIPIDANKEILDTLAELNSRQLKVLVYINQAILNSLIKSEWVQGFLADNFTNTDLFDVILWERNKVIVDEIINSEHEKIYITYWLLHFKWVLELLQKQDPNWQIIETKYLYPITGEN